MQIIAASLCYIVECLTFPGQAFSLNTKNLKNQVSTDEGSPADDDSYLGYSVATGEFTGDKDIDVAVGMPRGANLTGKVKIKTALASNSAPIFLFLGCPVQFKLDKFA